VLGVTAMVFIAIVMNISVMSWLSVLLVDETGVSGENYKLHNFSGDSIPLKSVNEQNMCERKNISYLWVSYIVFI
jgi:hypothetical protein